MPAASILSEITDLLTTVVGDYGLYAVFLLMLVDAVLPAASEPVMVYGGMYAVRFRATNELGAVEVVTPAFRVIRAAPVPVKKPKPRG